MLSKCQLAEWLLLDPGIYPAASAFPPQTPGPTELQSCQEQSGLACPQRRRAQLEGAVALFGFYGSCGELQSWLTKQTTLLQTLQPEANNLEVTQLKYEVPCC